MRDEKPQTPETLLIGLGLRTVRSRCSLGGGMAMHKHVNKQQAPPSAPIIAHHHPSAIIRRR